MYRRALERAPLLTNIFTAVPVMICGDIVAQKLESKKKNVSASFKVDPARTLVMASYSAFIFTPLFFNIYKLQERVVTRGGPFTLALQKSFFSILVGGVPANALFLSLATTVQVSILGRKPADDASLPQLVQDKLVHDLPRIMGGSLAFWGPVNFCNFVFIPIQYRVIASSCAGVAWNTYLSLIQHKAY